MNESRFGSLALALACAYACTGNTGTLDLFPNEHSASGGADGSTACTMPSCQGAGGSSGGTPTSTGGTRTSTDAAPPGPETSLPGACATEGDCRNGEGRFCVAGRCAECRGDGDCSSDDRHRCLANRCVECRDDGDCSSDKPGCVLSSGRCDDCSNDSQCEPGEHCNVDEGKCR